MPLSDVAARTLRPRERAYKVYDRDGLFLLVNPSGSKLWRWRYRFNQKEIAIGCSIDYNLTACGTPELASLIPGGGGDVGKIIGDVLDVGYALCSAGAITSGGATCVAFALYELANKVYGLLYNLLGLGPSAFKGSLMPRPGVPAPTDISSMLGVPMNGEDLDRQKGRSSRRTLQSPAFQAWNTSARFLLK